jgi:hypothetical protein
MVIMELTLNTYVIAANISWYTQKTIDGIRVLPIDGFSSTPFRPKYSVDCMSTTTQVEHV